MEAGVFVGSFPGFWKDIVNSIPAAGDKFIAAVRKGVARSRFSQRENVLALIMELTCYVDVSTWQYRTLISEREPLKSFE